MSMPERELVVRRVPIENVEPDPDNPRVHPNRNLQAIASSLRLFGQVEPLLVQAGTGRLIAGHGRLESLKQAGAAEVDVTEIDVSDSEARSLMLVLNRTAELAGWDDRLLGDAFAELADDGVDLEALGWAAWEIDPLLRGAIEPPEDGKHDESSRAGIRGISLTKSQRERFERARDQLREWAGEEVTEGDCVAQFADHFMDTPRAPVE
jgi:ParB-like chromosome segregation protein Spo0J